MKRLFFFLSAALVLMIAFSNVLSKAVEKTSVAESRGLHFEHGLHADVDCEACHAAVTSSTSGMDNLLPGHAQCSDCHDVDSDDGCATCHIGDPDAGARINDYSAKFDHSAHLKAGLDCAKCHANLDEPVMTGVQGHFPGMAECMSCHTEELVKTDCALCHAADENLLPKDHQLDWLTMHGIEAAESQNSCTMCHDIGNDCQACHNGDAVSSPHPRNYMSRHGHDAHLSTMRCGVCHDQRDFCNECHAAYNILPAGHYRPGWVTASGGAHADEAKFDLESCMACHDAPGTTPVCATCHGE